MKRRAMRVTGAIVALLLMFGAGVWIGITEHQTNADQGTSTPGSLSISLIPGASQPSNVDMSQFWEAWNLLNQDFVQTHSSTTPTDQQKVYGAIAGLAASYGDPYTVFFPPEQASIFNSDVSGSFEGVGMEIDNNTQGQIVVVAPLKGSPAQQAGVESGDIIVAIDGTSTQNMSADDAVQLIRGPSGSTVKLTIQRKGQSSLLTIPVVRGVINVPIINSYKRPDGIFVIQLYSFSANSANLFRDALRQFVQSGSHKLILDLRGNPGGYLDSAVQMASFFLPAGDTVVTEDFEGKQPNIVNRSYGYNVFAGDPNFKMAILVDQGTASAAEILSGALQQHGIAELVGTRTFGKGSVQEVMDLGGGAELKITVARWLTPNGTSIANGGLTPDIQVNLTDAEKAAGADPQMDAAAQWLTYQQYHQ